MSTKFWYTSEWSSFVLSTAKATDPSITYVVLGKLSPTEQSASPSIRVRSRDRHSPGSGNYFCSHVTAVNECCGYKVGSTLYACSIATDWVLVSGNTRNQRRIKYDQSTLRAETYYVYPSGGSWFTSYTLRVLSNPTFRSNRWYWHNTQWQSVSYGWFVPLETMMNRAMSSTPSTWENNFYDIANVDTSNVIGSPTFEQRYLADSIDGGLFPNLDCYLNDAYLNAFKSLPSIETNNIQNLAMIVGILGAIVKTALNPSEGIVDSVGTIGDAWLGFRYGFNTTKSDIQELCGYVDRMRNLQSFDEVRSHGYTSWDTDSGHYNLHCSITVHPQDVLNIYSTIERFGLALDGYNLWDLIPYSFIVDWFLHLGDLLQDARSRQYAMRLHPSACWYSITHTFTNIHGCNQCDYYRWEGSADLSSAMLPASMLNEGGARGSTWLMRGADALAIFT